ncbi:MAG: flagellar motor protein MotA [Bosea sp. (in: a-proteobacteria)]
MTIVAQSDADALPASRTMFAGAARHVLRVLVFLALLGFACFILQGPLLSAFMANPGLNGLILGVLAVGILMVLREFWHLSREAKLANGLEQTGNPAGLERSVTLAPLLPHWPSLARAALPPSQAAAALESVAVRLDDGREAIRYLGGLLVFLGLLGTFWGLLETVSSVGNVIKTLRTGAEAGVLFEELKAGLAAPLAGMGLSFSSSLFGIAGSLVLGFLDLQLASGQRRFRNSLEDWLGLRTGTEAASLNGQELAQHMAKLNVAMNEGSGSRTGSQANTQAMASLAEGVQGLVQHMRTEQQLIRDWVEAQAAREKELTRLINRLVADRAPEK